MTNFDVIESYAEDFTTWVVNKEGVIANVTSKSITITNVLNSNPLIYAYGTFSVRLKIDGLKDGQGIFFGDNKEYTISENGIYDIDTTENIRTNFIGECNITITQLPTSILKDFSGNGNHAYLYGGKGKLNSGMGVYEVDFTTYYGDVINSYTGRLTSNNKKNLGIAYNKLTKDIEPYTVKVTGIRKEVVRFTYRNEEGIEKDILIKNDGYYTVPKCYKDGTQGSSTTFVLFANYDNDTEVIIEQIPDYPDQLCYDGGMCAVVYEFPILTDYTIIADRTWFNIRDISCFIGKRNTSGDNLGAFEFEFRANRTFSFGGSNVIIFADNNIVYQTKNSYNGTEIKPGSLDDTDVLIIGAAQRNVNNKIQDPYIGCHGNILLFNRSLTEYEISWVKNNMMCSKQQEHDIDL